MIKRTVVLALAFAGLLHAQLGRTTDWFAYGGDAQRDGWEKNEQKFTKEDVKDFRLLWQRKLDNSKAGVGALLPPVVLGNLIGYRGFKELAIVAGSGNTLWSMDADLDRPYWTQHFAQAHPGKKACDSLTAAPALPAPPVFHLPAPKPAGAPSAGANPATPPRRSSIASGFTHPHPVFLLTGDGLLHSLNQSDGSEMSTPVPFVPAGAMAQPLNVFEDLVITSTRTGCGHTAAVWSLDTGDPAAKVKSYELAASAAGLSGVALGADGKAFVQTENGMLVELNADLTLNQYFAMPEMPAKKAEAPDMNVTAPVVFTFKGSEMVATTARDGRVYLLKAADAGGPDHRHYASKSLVLPLMDGNNEHGVWGGLASWEDTDGSRYLLAPVWGPLSAELQAAVPGTDAPHGSIVAFKVEDKDGAAALVPAWVSRDLESPAPPVIAKGVVFALANGKFSRSLKKAHGSSIVEEHPAAGTHATLFALDGTTGKEMYSTADQVTTAGNLTGLSVANGRIYFVTVDNTVQVFGKYLER